jgi:radical SAM protein with 4Fe4S-binding SPASM domain
MGYSGPNIDKNVLFKFVKSAANNGVKSIMVGGEGEPLLHPDLTEIINEIKNNNIDVALTTNGSLFDSEKSKQCLQSLSWVKFSLDAATNYTYAKVHGCDKKVFDTVLNNISYTFFNRKLLKCNCAIGVQFVLIPENMYEAYEAAKFAYVNGADYFVIKPYTIHPKSDIRIDTDYTIVPDEDEILSLAKEGFKVIIRKNAMSKKTKDKDYSECIGYKFWSYLNSTGDLYSCSSFLGDQNFCYGNIYKESLEEIWSSPKRKEVINRMSKLNVNNVDECRKMCRMDEINKYLWELKYPNSHVNFI